MTKKLMGLVASVALMSSGLALAHDKDKDKQQDTQSQSQGTGGSGSLGSDQSGSTQGSDIGGSGTSGQSGSQVGQSGQMGQSDQMGQSQLSGNQLTGRVVKSEKKMIWVEHAGAIVPLKIDKNTQFADPSLKQAKDIKEGDEIRASFEVRKTDNVATSIEKNVSPGTGGSGTDVMAPDQGINQPSDTLPPMKDDGTGGSGGDLGSDDPGSDIDQPDTRANPDANKASGDF